MRCTTTIAVLAVLALGPKLSAQHDDHHDTKANIPDAQLGVVSFENSGARAAQKDFLRGLALLHSFMYDQAAASFQKAQKADPAFAMAYWGEAMTYVHTAWRQENLAAANTALDRLAPTRDARLAKAGTSRERAYGAAIEALVAKNLDEARRVHAFSDTMHAIAAKYPKDLDARSFAALGGMNVSYLWPAADPAQRERDHSESEALAYGVFKESPKHPGGVHYLIHVNDDPTYASRGLDAARAYAKVAPDADHALHMPSHIFVQLGLWDDATRSNERAWPASRTAYASPNDPSPSASWHTLHWLQYSYLQQGRLREARALIDSARTILGDPPADYWGDADARFAVSALLFRYAAETGDGWAGIAAEATAEGSDVKTPRGATFTANARYHAAVAGVMTGDTSDAHALIQRLGAATPRRPRDEVQIGQLAGLIAIARGDTAAAIAAWQRASVAEEAIPPLGPPNMLVSHEWLGDLLLKSGKRPEAIAAYQKALQRRPGRARALRALASARVSASPREIPRARGT